MGRGILRRHFVQVLGAGSLESQLLSSWGHDMDPVVNAFVERLDSWARVLVVRVGEILWDERTRDEAAPFSDAVIP